MEFSKYEINDLYPQRPAKPQLASGHTSAQLKHYAVAFEKWEKLTAAFKEAVASVRSRRLALDAQFKVDALESVGWTHRPGRDLVYAMAWERGHSSGFGSVYSELVELTELCAAVVLAHDQDPGIIS